MTSASHQSCLICSDAIKHQCFKEGRNVRVGLGGDKNKLNENPAFITACYFIFCHKINSLPRLVNSNLSVSHNISWFSWALNLA